MLSIFHDFPIKAPVETVFAAMTTPEGLDCWWTKHARGQPALGEEYELYFGPEHDWRAKVSSLLPNEEFELEMIRADQDWTGTRVGIRLEPREDATWVRFRHAG
jgi:uncharacterized protein YndB with AHSA1/START domain